MANVLVKESSLENIADAIRSKNGTQTKYKPAQMADAITAISGGGGITPSGTKTINITQNGTVTEDVTNYANAQVNVNVPNSYSSSDEGKVVSNGALTAQTSRQVTANGTYDTTLNSSVEVNVPTGITPTGTKNITTNGDHDVTNFATAHVDVPTGITPTGTKQISITENGTTTEDVTNYANAEITVNVQSGGGGVHTEEGYVELTDTIVGNSPALTIPVDLTSAEGFILNLYAVETGEVVDGVVTKYDKIEVPTETGTNATWIFNYMMKYPLNPVPEIYRDATNLATIRQAYNVTYAYTRRDWNGGQIGLVSSPTIASNGLSVQTGNNTRFFCYTGAYVKFKYEITWW